MISKLLETTDTSALTVEDKEILGDFLLLLMKNYNLRLVSSPTERVDGRVVEVKTFRFVSRIPKEMIQELSDYVSDGTLYFYTLGAVKTLDKTFFTIRLSN